LAAPAQPWPLTGISRNPSRQLLHASPKGAYCWRSTSKRRTAGTPDRRSAARDIHAVVLRRRYTTTPTVFLSACYSGKPAASILSLSRACVSDWKLSAQLTAEKPGSILSTSLEIKRASSSLPSSTNALASHKRVV